MTTELEVTAVVKLHESGQLKGFADVTLAFLGHELVLPGFRINQDDQKEPWVALPESNYEKDGVIKNKQFLNGSPRLMRHIRETVLNAYREAIAHDTRTA